MKTKGKVCRRVLATFILAAMLVTSSAVTAYAAPEGATVIDLTVAGGGGGQDSSACVLHSSYDDEGHFLICDTHTGTGTWNTPPTANGLNQVIRAIICIAPPAISAGRTQDSTLSMGRV